jgi:hypothetical protein
MWTLATMMASDSSPSSRAVSLIEALTDDQIAKRKKQLREMLASSAGAQRRPGTTATLGKPAGGSANQARPKFGEVYVVKGAAGGGGIAKVEKEYPKPKGAGGGDAAGDGTGGISTLKTVGDSGTDTAGGGQGGGVEAARAAAVKPQEPPKPVEIKSFNEIMAEKRAKREAEAAAAAGAAAAAAAGAAATAAGTSGAMAGIAAAVGDDRGNVTTRDGDSSGDAPAVTAAVDAAAPTAAPAPVGAAAAAAKVPATTAQVMARLEQRRKNQVQP